MRHPIRFMKGSRPLPARFQDPDKVMRIEAVPMRLLRTTSNGDELFMTISVPRVRFLERGDAA